MTCALLPAANQREISPEDQLRLTGLPTSSFAPPRGGSPTDVLAGGAGALAASALASQLPSQPTPF